MLSNIRFSTITIDECKRHMRIEEDFTEDDEDIEMYLTSAKALILDNSGMDIEMLDNFAFYSVNLVLYIVSDLYHHREVTSSTVRYNPMFKMMMGKVRVYNLE